MTGWIIALSILLFFLLLMISPVYLSVRLGEENKVAAGYLFLRFSLYPRKPKKAKKEKKKKQELPKQEKKQEVKEEAASTAKDTIGMLMDLAKASASPVFHLLRRTYLVNLDLRIEVGGEDAAEIALNTAKYRSAVACFVALFRNLRMLKFMRHAAVNPNFLKEKTEYRVRFCIMIRLGTILYAVLAAGIGFLMRKIKGEAENASPSQADHVGQPASMK